MRPTAKAMMVVSIALCGCSGVEVSEDPLTSGPVEPRVSVEEAATWTWERAPFLTSGTAEQAEDVEKQVESALGMGLEEVGLTYTSGRRPDVLVSARISVATRRQEVDRYFAHWGARRYEEGSITLVVRDRLTRETIWSATARRNIRYVANVGGTYTSREVPLDREREWRIDEMVSALMGELRSAR